MAKKIHRTAVEMTTADKSTEDESRRKFQNHR
jgi:hypothetical protein